MQPTISNGSCDYIAETRPESARRAAQAIVQGIASLDPFPNRGRPGRVEGTREFVFASLPFVAVYEYTMRCGIADPARGAAVAASMTPERWQQVSQLYHAALARDDRSPFLAEACGGDEPLRRELESLLAHPASAEAFLASPAFAVEAPLMSDAGAA